MKVELNGTWPLFGHFFNLSQGKSGAASYVINLAPILKNKNPSAETTTLPEAIKSSIEELDKEEFTLPTTAEIRGIILHKAITLSQSKQTRSSLLEFLLLLLNNEMYPKTDLKHFECALVGLCFGLGKVIHKGKTKSIKEEAPKISIDSFPGTTKAELEVLTSKAATRIVSLFLKTYKLSVSSS